MSRPPAVGGIFYDADPHDLRAEVSRLLASTRTPSGSGRPKAMIVPHAGYQYSGQVAATAFATLGQRAPTIERDQEVLAAISGLPAIEFTDEPHAPEHALEVELPFLQLLLPRLTAVPLLVGDTTPQDVAAVLRRVWGGPETVLVISSDLSHFHEYETARRRDAATATMIENGDWASLGPADACGYLAIAGLLVESKRRGLRARCLSLCNSGDQVGSRDPVVGYGAWVFWTAMAGS